MADKLTDKERDKKRKEMDANKDGTITPEERDAWKATQPDTLSRKELAARYDYSLDVIYSNKELKDLFLRALDAKEGQWTTEKFIAEVKNTEWWKKGAFWRSAYISEKTGGGDWANSVQTASEMIRRRATDVGATLTDADVAKLSRRFLYGGWSQSNRGYLLDDALSRFITGDAPDNSDTEAVLRQYAYEYGVQGMYDDKWYTDAMKSIANGNSNVETWQQAIREAAKSKYVTFSGAIDNGQSTRQAAKPYTSAMSSILEIDESNINMDDPLLKQAWMGQNDEQGKPKMMTLYDFETQLRKDPRWQSTKNGRQTTMNAAQSFLKSLGFVGQ